MYNVEYKEQAGYAFGHLVGSIKHPDDAHAADSHEHAFDVMNDVLDLSEEAFNLMNDLAEFVAANYEYTGAGLIAGAIKILDRMATEGTPDAAR